MARSSAVVAASAVSILPAVAEAQLLAAPVTAGTEELLVRYQAWLHMERRLLCIGMWPEMGAKADCFTMEDGVARDFHFPSGQRWQDVPQPATRAALVLGTVGISLEHDPASGFRWGLGR